MCDGVGKGRQEGVADAKALDTVEIEIGDFLIGDGAIAVDVGIEDRAIETVELKPGGAETERPAAVEIARADRNAIARGDTGPALAVVGVAHACGQAERRGHRIGRIGERGVDVALGAGVELKPLEKSVIVRHRAEVAALLLVEEIAARAVHERRGIVEQAHLVIVRD